jgi:hypothetical protein
LDNDGAPTPPSAAGRRVLGVALVALGLAWAALALLDPQRPSGIMGGPAAAALGLLLAGRPRRLRVVLPAVLGAAAAVSAYGLPEFRGDSASYFAYVRSAVLDRDLDFANEWEHWGYPEPARTVTGLRQNVQSVGPAVLWTPFYLLAHAYVRLGLGAAPYPADGYSAPYRRAAALGTLAAVTLGAGLLYRVMASRFGRRIALLALGGAAVGSPIAYYTFVVPTMAHGAAFAAAAALVWAWDRAERRPCAAAWAAIGACLGLVTLMRWQGIVCALLAAPLVVRQLQQRTARVGWALVAAAAGALVFVPQLIAWNRLYGRPGDPAAGPRVHGLVVPAPLGHPGLRRPRPVHLDADPPARPPRPGPHAPRRARLRHRRFARLRRHGVDQRRGAGLGGQRRLRRAPVRRGGAAPRRWASAACLARAAPLLARHPLWAPAALLSALALWNLGFIAVFRAGAYPGAAPLERVARDQARVLKAAAQGGAGRGGRAARPGPGLQDAPGRILLHGLQPRRHHRPRRPLGPGEIPAERLVHPRPAGRPPRLPLGALSRGLRPHPARGALRPARGDRRPSRPRPPSPRP